MSTTREARNQTDPLAESLATYVAKAQEADTSARARPVARLVLDSLAVGLGALEHPAARAAHRYAEAFGGTNVLWGTSSRADVEVATLVNGVLLRCYDYNDLYIGEACGGHPSDVLAGLLAVAEARRLSGSVLVTAVSAAYDVTATLFDTVPAARSGWDYSNLTAIGATCGIAAMLGFDQATTRQALAITSVPHVATNEIESGDLNERGDLTMWKRFNGADAVRQAVYACLLAEAGAEGVVRPYTGRMGVLRQMVGDGAVDVDDIAGRLARLTVGERLDVATLKRWPVGSRGQSAIQAALEARSQLGGDAEIAGVHVTCDPAVHAHLVAAREDPWHPISRETADHSLPYIVAAAVLDGRIGTDSFSPEIVSDAARQQFLAERVTVEADDALAVGIAGGFPSRVEVITTAGDRAIGVARPFPGHPANPLTDAQLETKFHENAAGRLDDDVRAAVVATTWRLGELGSVTELTDHLVPGQ